MFNFWGSLQCLRHFLFGTYVSPDAVHRLAHITPPVFLAVIANHVFFAMAEERKYNYYNCVDGMDKYDTTYVVREPD